MECYSPLNFQSLFQLGIALNLGFSYLVDSCNLVRKKYEQRMASTGDLIQDLKEMKKTTVMKDFRLAMREKKIADISINRIQYNLSFIMTIFAFYDLYLLISYSFVLGGYCEPGITLFVLALTTFLPVTVSSVLLYIYTRFKYRVINALLDGMMPKLGSLAK